MKANTYFKTENAARYLGTLCKHFGHKVPVTHDADVGRIELPFGICELRGDETGLAMNVTAKDKRHLDKTVQVVTSHLERFAFRENPEVSWSTATEADA